jgi:hypothetical protein
MVAGSIGTYGLLRLSTNNPHDSATFFQTISGKSNFSWGSLVALLIVSFGSFALSSALPKRQLLVGDSADSDKRTTVTLYIISLPYLIISVIGGIWSEALRLMMPILICQYLLSFFAQ